jgi:hypothetical protein
VPVGGERGRGRVGLRGWAALKPLNFAVTTSGV